MKIEWEWKECCCLLGSIDRWEVLQDVLLFTAIGKGTHLDPLAGRETGVGGARDLYSLSSFPFPFFRMIYFNLGGRLLIFLLYLNLFTSCPINQLSQVLRVVGDSPFLFFLSLSPAALFSFVGSSSLTI